MVTVNVDVDINPSEVLDDLSDDELLGECRRRHLMPDWPAVTAVAILPAVITEPHEYLVGLASSVCEGARLTAATGHPQRCVMLGVLRAELMRLASTCRG